MVAVSVTLERRGAASLTLLQEVKRGDELLSSASVRIACIDAERFVPQAIPDYVVERVESRYGPARAAAARNK